MKPAAAFAAGLWTGAAVIAAVGVFYLRVWELGRTGSGPLGREKLETRIQLLQQEQTRAQAEEARKRKAAYRRIGTKDRREVWAAVVGTIICPTPQTEREAAG